MAWVTTLGPSMQQIEYRLTAEAGCSLAPAEDGQVAYRLESDRPLEWIGAGVAEVGLTPGGVLDAGGIAAARALADGVDPRTGAVLVAPKKAIAPEAKLDAAPVVDAVRRAAADAGVTPAELLGERRLVARYGRLQRGVARAEARAQGGPAAETVAHRAPVGDLEAIAAAAGVEVDGLYDPAELATAREHRDDRVVVGNRGYDLTLDLPKSYSVLMALAPAEVAAVLEDAYLDAVRETVTAMQDWAGYGLRGHHGDGQTATRVDGTGLLGWMTVHRTARPTPGAAPDPHLHAHVTLLNLVKGVDGKWSTIGAGGRDIHRHAHAADAYLKARLRRVTQERWGIQWARDPKTGAWEIAAVPPALRKAFSKRADRVEQQLRDAGLSPEVASTAQAKQAAAASREAKIPAGTGGDLRVAWRGQAVAAGVDPDQLVADAMPGPPGPTGPAPGRGPTGPDLGPDRVAAHVFRPEHGLTAHTKVTTRADVLAAALDAQPAGVTDLDTAEQLVDAVLAQPVAVPLPPAGATHLSNAGRWTSIDVLDAERTVLAAARDRYAGRYGLVDEQVLAGAIATFEAGEGLVLGAEQRAVLQRLAAGGHGVDAVIGVAGAGKTTIMSALRSAYEATGQTVAGAATAAVAAQNLQAEAGIESYTIAKWLRRIGDGPGLDGVDVLVVDEAAMVDDRHLAALLTEAGRTGTKTVLIGDPQQLRAVGVGGAFAAVHQLVDGLTLADNRRQRDHVERHALAVWRDQQRRAALDQWNASGRLHVVDEPGQAHAAMAAAWSTARAELGGDPHEQIERLLMLAHTNADVETLNQAARQVRVDAGELGPALSWPQTGGRADGGTLTLAVGDVVMTRTNDRKLGVLNGHRGVVTDLDEHGRVQVERRRSGPDGPELVRAWVPAAYVQSGGVQLAYAITAAKSQGLTCDRTLVYGNGMDAYVAYPAMSRDRHRVDLWLALEPLETDADRARHGPPASDAEARQRAVDAYAAALERDQPDRLLLAELGEAPDPIAPAAAEAVVDQAVVDQDAVDWRARAARTPAVQPAPAAGYVGWERRRHGAVPTEELADQIADARARAARALQNAQTHQAAAEQLAAAAAAGDGPAMRALRDQRARLAEQAAAAQTAAAARQAEAAARQAARQAWVEARRLEAETGRGRLALRLSGTSRPELAARRAQAIAAAQDATRAADQHHERAWEAERAAGLPVSGQVRPGQHPVERLAALDTAWTAHAAQAQAADGRQIDQRRQQADRARTDATEHARRATGLHTEAQLRARLQETDPTRLRIEDAGRQVRRAQQALRRAAHQRQQDAVGAERARRQAHIDAHRRRPPDLGPTLGR